MSTGAMNLKNSEQALVEAKINKIDLWILIPILALIAFSLGVVYSASSSWSVKINGDSGYLFRNHLVRAGFGVVMLFFFSRVDYKHLIRFRKPLMFLAVSMLLYLLIAGVETTKGAARWIRFEHLASTCRLCKVCPAHKYCFSIMEEKRLCGKSL
jgi:cell division protein FtsW